MDISGIHYGLTLLYSYLLPLFNVEEVSDGFVFEKTYGTVKGLFCRFSEKELVTTCRIPRGVDRASVLRVLGLEKQPLFTEFSDRVGVSRVKTPVTLVYEPGDVVHVFYAIYLSRNTDYYVNTIRWARQAYEEEFVTSSSYIALEFNRLKRVIDGVFEKGLDPLSTAISLMEMRGVGIKSVTALLLHGYGLTEYAPVDRHYAEYLGVERYQPQKEHCVKLRLNCKLCSRGCPYRYAVVKYGVYNGFVQSLVYIHARLSASRRSELEEVLVKDPADWLNPVEEVLNRAREFSI